MKNMFVLKLPPFFPCRVGEGKSAAISELAYFSKKRVRFYIALALDIWLLNTRLLHINISIQIFFSCEQ